MKKAYTEPKKLDANPKPRSPKEVSKKETKPWAARHRADIKK